MSDPDAPSPEKMLGLADAAPGTEFDPEQQLWEGTFAPLQQGAVTPPADLWDRIAARLPSRNAVPGTVTIPPEDGLWEPFLPGISRKLLHVDGAGNALGYYLKIEAGAELPAHPHGAGEHCVVLSGELLIGEGTFGPGTYHFAPAGVPHPAIIARTDAVFFILGGLGHG